MSADAVEPDIRVRCSDGVACDPVIDAYTTAGNLHAVGEHVAADQLAGVGDATAARHGLWQQLEQEVAT